MPIYEYECRKCGHQLEAIQKVSGPPLRKCPNCAQRTLQKLISSPVFRLKGSGWYETDFKSDKEGKRNLADSPEKDEKKDEKKEEPKEDRKKEESTAEPAAASSQPDTPSASATKPAVATAATGKPARATTRARRRVAHRPK